MLLSSQCYLVRVKRAVVREGLWDNVHYLERIKRKEFLLTLFAFVAEDMPNLVIAIVVLSHLQQLTAVNSAQLATSATSAAFFVIKAALECRAARQLRVAAQLDSRFDKKVFKNLKHAPGKDLKNRNLLIPETIAAAGAVVREPNRARRAKQQYQQDAQAVATVFANARRV